MGPSRHLTRIHGSVRGRGQPLWILLLIPCNIEQGITEATKENKSLLGDLKDKNPEDPD